MSTRPLDLIDDLNHLCTSFESVTDLLARAGADDPEYGRLAALLGRLTDQLHAVVAGMRQVPKEDETRPKPRQVGAKGRPSIPTLRTKRVRSQGVAIAATPWLPRAWGCASSDETNTLMLHGARVSRSSLEAGGWRLGAGAAGSSVSPQGGPCHVFLGAL